MGKKSRKSVEINQDLPEGIQDRKEVFLFFRVRKRVIVSMPLTTLSHIDTRTPHFTDNNNIASYEENEISRWEYQALTAADISKLVCYGLLLILPTNIASKQKEEKLLQFSG